MKVVYVKTCEARSRFKIETVNNNNYNDNEDNNSDNDNDNNDDNYYLLPEQLHGSVLWFSAFIEECSKCNDLKWNMRWRNIASF